MVQPYLYTLLLGLVVGISAQGDEWRNDPRIFDGWTAFGDSFAAGIGAGTVHDDDSGNCRRRDGAYPAQIHTSGVLDRAGSSPTFQFLACSGAKIADVQHQVTAFQGGGSQFKDFATLSVGGNDVGFADLLQACLFRASLFLPTCAEQIATTRAMIHDPALAASLRNTYKQITDAAGVPTHFKLAVTGYPRFFSVETDGCDSKSMNFWPLTTERHLLSQQHRRNLNDLTNEINHVIEVAVNDTNAASLFQQIFFVDINDSFEGHRFCEPGVNEPDNTTPGTWFFLLNGRDASPDGSLLPPDDNGAPVSLTPSQCETILDGGVPPLGIEWGEHMICAVQKGLSEGMDLPDWLQSGDNDFTGSIDKPETWAKAFHPKTIGHASIRDRIEQVVGRTSASLKRVLIMFDGSDQDYEAMLSHRLNSFLAPDTINLGGHSVKGYATWLTPLAALEIRDTVTGVVGVLFETDLAQIALPTSVGNTKRAIQEDADQESNTTQSSGPSRSRLRLRSPATTTDLSFDEAWSIANPPVTQDDIRHLIPLSRSPRSQAERYRDYGSRYLYDPQAGEGVTVYVLDTGTNLGHPEFTHYNRIARSYVSNSDNEPMEDRNGHGTCMASMVGGRIFGVTKTGANLVPVKWQNSDGGPSARGADLFRALQWILTDVRATSKQGRAVISFSQGTPSINWKSPGDSPEDLSDSDLNKIDPWTVFLPHFQRNDIVVVTSGGNGGESNPVYIRDFSPRRHAVQGGIGHDSLIVVGGLGQDGNPWVRADKFVDIITVWALAENVRCASINDAHTQSGTSISTATVAGLVATFLGRADLQAELQIPGQVAVNTKEFVQKAARYHSDNPSTGVNRLGTYNYIPCNAPFDDTILGSGPPDQFPVSPHLRITVRTDGIALNHPPNSCHGLDPVPTVGLYTFQDCIQDRDAPNQPLRDGEAKRFTLEECHDECQGLQYFGMARGEDCYCGDVAHDLEPLELSECAVTCRDNPNQICGGADALSLYKTSSFSGELLIQSVDGWSYSGCYVDDGVRTLSDGQGSADNMTPAMCAALCDNYSWFGVEYGAECWCGNNLDSSRLATDASTCNSPCAGRPSSACGGGWRLTVYGRGPVAEPELEQVPGWASVGCYTDDGVRTLPDGNLGSNQMTAGMCAENCCGWRYFGVENGNECWCGNTLDPALAAPAGDCTSTCAGARGYLCGGGWRLNVYEDLPGDAPGCEGQIASSSLTTTEASTLSSTRASHTTTTTSTGTSTTRTSTNTTRTGTTSTSTTGTTTSTRTTTSSSRTTTTSTRTTTTTPAPTCGSPQACDSSGCNGSFNSGGSSSTCKAGSRIGCACIPTTAQCGTAQSCNANGCAGTFDSNGYATCKGNWATCRCLPQASQCGTQAACDVNGCNGSFDNGGTVATCKAGARIGCSCRPVTATCGTRASCDANGCAGTFNSDGIATCKGMYATCRCNPTTNTCGTAQSCDANGCAGTFNSNGIATCKGLYATCTCNPTTATCGARQSCDANNCAGRFSGNQPYARCTNYRRTCECLATSNTCGARQNCNLNGCAGTFDVNSLTPYCRSNFRGCACTPVLATCGGQRWQCKDNGCAGTRDSDGVWRCKENYGGCGCYVYRAWAKGGTVASILVEPTVTLWGNDNECANVPSDWNDRISDVGLRGEGSEVGCQLFLQSGCSGNHVYVTGNGGHSLVGTSFDEQVSSFKCWRFNGNNNNV